MIYSKKANNTLFQSFVAVDSRIAQFLLNTDELIVFGHAVGTRKRTNLVHFNQYRVGCAHLDALLQELGVGYKQVVAYQLAAVANLLGQFYPVVPVVLVESVLDRVDRILGDELFQIGNLLVG